MDWGNVTAEDLVDALREVDWSTPPRPLNEFFSRFTLPRSYNKWSSRLKCNLYYYRTNYFCLILFVLGIGFLRKPLAIVAALLTGLSIAFLNDRNPILVLLGHSLSMYALLKYRSSKSSRNTSNRKILWYLGALGITVLESYTRFVGLSDLKPEQPLGWEPHDLVWDQ